VGPRANSAEDHRLLQPSGLDTQNPLNSAASLLKVSSLSWMKDATQGLCRWKMLVEYLYSSRHDASQREFDQPNNDLSVGCS
jgi:hypothetical protein